MPFRYARIRSRATFIASVRETGRQAPFSSMNRLSMPVMMCRFNLPRSASAGDNTTPDWRAIPSKASSNSFRPGVEMASGRGNRKP
jgi:hypothetical protein